MGTVIMQLLAYVGAITTIGCTAGAVITAIDKAKANMKKRDSDLDKIQRKLDSIIDDVTEIRRQAR